MGHSRRGRPGRQRNGTAVLAAVTITAVIVLTQLPGIIGADATSTDDVTLAASTETTTDDATSSTTTSPTTEAPTTTTTLARSTADADAAAAVAAGRSGTVEWALVDLATGQTFSSGTFADPQEGIDAASMGKVLIAVAAVEQGLTDDPTHLALLQVMIEQSDNDAASTLYRAVGGADAIQDLMDRTGMTSSHVGRNWGAMNITAADMASFLTQLATGDLLGAATDAVLEPMRDVISSQRWGVAQAVTSTPATAVKNGWYPDTDGMWRLHCSAVVGDVDATAADEGVAVVVMTHYSQELGMAYGEETCRLVAAALLPDTLTA